MKADVAGLEAFEESARVLLFRQKSNDFLDILQRIIERFPLAVATGKNGALYSIEAVFILFDHERELQIFSGAAPRNRPNLCHNDILPSA